MIWYLNSKLDLNLSCAKFCCDLVYKLKKIVSFINFSAQFIKKEIFLIRSFLLQAFWNSGIFFFEKKSKLSQV